MTIQRMHELFELIQDHHNTAYYPEEEISTFLNAAQKGIFNKLVFYGDSQAEPDVPEGIKFSGKYELDEQKTSILGDLIVLDEPVAAVGGIVSFDNIETASSKTLALITGITDAQGDPIKIVRQGEWNEFKKNYFTNAEYTLARIGSGGVKIDGATTETFNVSFIAEPEDMDLTTPVQPSLRGVHEAIVIDALKLAGFALNDEALMMIKE